MGDRTVSEKESGFGVSLSFNLGSDTCYPEDLVLTLYRPQFPHL